MADYSPSEIIDMIIIYGSCAENARETARQYGIKYPDRRKPDYKTILSLIARARNGSLKRKRSKKSFTDDDNTLIVAVLGMVVMNPHISQRQISREINVSYGIVNRILKANHYHAYHISLHQELSDNDKILRVEFCRWALQQIIRDPFFFLKVMFSDEASFKSNGIINRHNSHYYSTINPHWLEQIDHQRIWNVNVWCGIINGQIIGPYFFDGNITGIKYLSMLENDLPAMLENVDLHTRQQMFIQQDGAPPHYSRRVRDFFDDRYANRWIGRGSQIRWPPRSPDLTSPDFFLWGFLKGTVYADRPNSPEQMKERIRTACKNISSELLLKTVEAFEKRVRLCIEVDGNVFEHLL